MESCEIYIKGIEYENSEWSDKPDNLLELMYDNFNEIDGFYFIGLSLNMAQVYNVNLKSSNYDAMNLHIKGVKYKHRELLSLNQVKKIELKIKQQLNYIETLKFKSVEFRTLIFYRDIDLYPKEKTGVVRTPIIIERE